MKINAGTVSRKEYFLVDPDEIVVVEEDNAREIPHTDEEIAALAAKILAEGQLQMAGVRKIADNKLKLIYGYGRWRAIKLLREQGHDIRLGVVIKEANDKEAFLMAISENSDRTDSRPLDDARNQRVLREQFGMTEQEIAQVYEQTVAYVCTLKKGLSAIEPIRQLVRAKVLTMKDAYDLAGLPEEAQRLIAREAHAIWETPSAEEEGADEEAAEEAEAETEEAPQESTSAPRKTKKKTKKKPAKEEPTKKAARVRKAVREKISEGRRERGKATPPSAKKVREFLEGLTGAGERGPVRELAGALLEFVTGKIGQAEAEQAFQDYCAAR